MSIPSGAAIGSVVVEHRIASDATGDVSLARQPALDRTVILRRLRRDLLGSERLVDRFQREARFGARLIHPNIVQVFDCFAYAGDRYLLLEHVEGAVLREVMERARRVPPRVAAHIALELCRALREVHSRRLVHADLRPEHVRVSRWGDVKLTGFGCARELGQPGPPGEAGPYRAPEANGHEPLGWGADVRALGVLLREMTTGDALADPRVALPDRGLARLVAKCLRANPETRPSVREVARVLTRRLGDPSPSESRAEIAAWLWETRIFRPTGEPAEVEHLRAELAPLRRSRVPRQVWIGAAAAAAGILFALTLAGVERGADSAAPAPDVAAAAPDLAAAAEMGDEGVRAPAAEEPPAVAAGPLGLPATAASVSFVAYPWAEIEIDGGESFLTPRAEPVSLPPGPHEVIFRHPRYGEERRQLQLGSGQEEVVRHVFMPSRQP